MHESIIYVVEYDGAKICFLDCEHRDAVFTLLCETGDLSVADDLLQRIDLFRWWRGRGLPWRR